MYFTNIQYSKVATIASSGTTSNAIDLENLTLCGIITPAALTGTAFTITTSDEEDGTYVTVQDGDGADLSIVVAASKYIPISNLALTAGLRFIKLVSNGTEAAERTIKVISRQV